MGTQSYFPGKQSVRFKNREWRLFCAQERELADVPLRPGPFAHVLQLISELQQRTEEMREGWKEDAGIPRICTALVTARSAPAHERAIRTLRAWGIRIDQAFFWEGWIRAGSWRHLGHTSFLMIMRRMWRMLPRSCFPPEFPGWRRRWSSR